MGKQELGKMNYHELLNQAKQELAAAGKVEKDAKELLLFIKGWDLQDYLLRGGADVLPEDAACYADLLKQRIAGVPLQEITGSQNFYGYEIGVSPDVLTPRPETELLAELVLREIAELRQPKVLDLCTGSGCLAIALAAENPAAEVTAVDISEKALAQAQQNGERHGLGNRIQWQQSDLFAALSGETFDVIVTNPPYIPTAELRSLEPEVRNYDPQLALDGGADGLDFYRRIAEQAANYLRKRLPTESPAMEKKSSAEQAEVERKLPQDKTGSCKLFMEIGCEQGVAVTQLLRVNGWQEIRVLPDFTGRDRMVMATLPRVIK